MGSKTHGEGERSSGKKEPRMTGMNNKMNIPMVERVEASAAECVCHELIDTVQSGISYCSNIVKSMISKRPYAIV